VLPSLIEAGAVGLLGTACRASRDTRIATWRKLRRLGAAQLVTAFVALPLTNRNREQFEWLAGEIAEAGGDATLWVGQLTSKAQERELAARMTADVAAGVRALVESAAQVREPGRLGAPPLLGRLRRELRRIRARDYSDA